MPIGLSSTEPVDDLTTEKATVIFILESPHTDELAEGFPLAGESGIAFAKALLPDKTRPAGRQIKGGGIPFSVMNTFLNSLKLSPQLRPLNVAIEGLVFAELGPFNYKNAVLDAIRLHTSPSLADSYKERLLTMLEVSEKSVRIVVCGNVAQAYFEYALKLPRITFAKRTPKQILGHDVEILYVEHPSTRNQKPTYWTDEQRLRSLQEFVNGN